jgi:hypothetical protein
VERARPDGRHYSAASARHLCPPGRGGALAGTRDLDLTYRIAWADACATLLDAEHGGAARVLLHHLLDYATADAAFAAMAGGLFKPPDEVTLRRELCAAADAPPIQPPVLPWWAEYGAWMGPSGAPPPVFGTETLDLGGDPGSGPPVTVAAFAFGNEPLAVLVEVSGSGTPTHVEPWQARRMATALLSAADLVDQARAGGNS